MHSLQTKMQSWFQELELCETNQVSLFQLDSFNKKFGVAIEDVEEVFDVSQTKKKMDDQENRELHGS